MDLTLKTIYTIILLFVILVLCLSCNPNKTNKKQVINHFQKSDIGKSESKNKKIGANRNSNPIFSNRLIPMEIVDSSSSNLYKKFGIELGGNCYSCDLAEIKLTEKYMVLHNVCDPQVVIELPIESISVTKEVVEIHTSKRIFIFTKIAKTPIYHLSVKGTSLNLQNLRLSEYFTLITKLLKFEQKDCGNFQG